MDDAVAYTIDGVPGGTSESEPSWSKYLQLDDHGQVIPNLANAALALRQAPELAGVVAYDLMLRHALVTRSVPSSRMAVVTKPRPLQDTDVAAIQEWLQRHHLRRVGKETTHQACDLVAREQAFHPVRDYLTGLRWDGEQRLDGWLNCYIGAKPTPYTKAIGRMFLIAMVARIMQPGCKADYMVVLEGPQGARKSTACAILGGAWFSDSLPDVTRGKDVAVHLNGKWLMEVPEMSAMSKAEAGALKSFITRDTERYRPPYGREEVIEPRQCVFVGTTNQSVYLHDETGGRRFWPVKIGVIDTEALAQDRDQLFAEAVAAFQIGKKWWPTAEFEQTHIIPEQEERFEVDAWEWLIADWLAMPGLDTSGRPHPPRTRCTVSELATMAVKLEVGRLGKVEQQRITKALRRLGWDKRRNQSGRWWERDAASMTA
jgi:predicted P-loop ATPase